MTRPEKLRGIAIIGCGQWGINHVRTSLNLFGSKLKYVCDMDPRQAERIRSLASAVQFTSNLDQILNDPDVNAVIVATPAQTHFSITKLCLEAGKHVLVEKPLALLADDAKKLDQIAIAQGRVLMVGHLLLYHPAIRAIHDLIEQGKLGKVQYIYSNRLNLGTIRKEENILWSFAPHDISVLQYLIGENPIEVDAKGGIFLQPGIHDVTLTTLRYPQNILAHVHVSWLHPFKEHRLVVIGSRNMVVFEDSKPKDKLILYPKGIDWVNGEPKKRDSDYEVIPFSNLEPLAEEQKHFINCLETGQKPLTDGKNGIAVLEILQIAQERLNVQPNATSQATSTRPPKNLIHETAVIDEGCDIGEQTRVWHFSHIQSGSRIGSQCTLGQGVNIGNRVKIGNHVKIQNNVSVYEGVELEDYVFCGPSMVFTNVLNPRCEFPQRGSDHYKKTLVQFGASLGANSTIVCGNTIGRFAFVGAGAVVTRDVPDYALVTGNPARIRGWICRCGEKLRFEKDHTNCEKCDRRYSQKDGKVISNETPETSLRPD